MKIYVVGGCVRDMLLGRTATDIDFVVVGATPEQMISAGYSQVGSSFPVFLKDGCEYALARTERKTGVGYYGFETSYDPNVTLEDDLKRRDLTINSMAYDEATQEIIDPFNGRDDLQAGVLRHTSEAFAEDPVRVLRTARFSARYGFKVADETIELMRLVVPELDFVPAERVWNEIQKGLMETYPNKMFEVLRVVHAFETAVLKPFYHAHFDQLKNVQPEHDLAVRFALTCDGFKDEDFFNLHIPNDCALVGRTMNKYFTQLASYCHYSKEQRLQLLQELRAFNTDTLLKKCLTVFAFYAGENNKVEEWLLEDLRCAMTVNAAEIAAQCKTGPEIKKRLFKARLKAM